MQLCSMDVNLFYGKDNTKRRSLEIARKLYQNEELYKTRPLPLPYSPRISQPCSVWKTFYRQQDAFDLVKNTNMNLHVFSFESETFFEKSGQRCFLTTTYEQFWHYYRQLTSEQRHHYEVIAAGAVCHLYFDMEFNISANPGSNGAQMTSDFITFFCICIEYHFGLRCNASNVLQLDSSLPEKFSRHLVFHLPGAVFKDNINAGAFVHWCLSRIPAVIKSFEAAESSGERLVNDTTKSNQSNPRDDSSELKFDQSNFKDQSAVVVFSQNDSLYSYVNTTEFSDLLNQPSSPPSEYPVKSSSSLFANFTPVKNKEDTVQWHSESELSHRQHAPLSDDSFAIEENTSFVYSPHTSVSDRNLDECLSACDSTDNFYSAIDSELFNDATFLANLSERQLVGTDVNEEIFYICCKLQKKNIKTERIKQFFVKNKNGDPVSFCDAGVYTKNRNFRLYLSCKLGKHNPLLVSTDNLYDPEPIVQSPLFPLSQTLSRKQRWFLDSLVTNVSYSISTRVLSFEFNSRQFKQNKSEKEKATEIRESYTEESPYPLIDEFVRSLINSRGQRGSIRRWSYFNHAEMIIYDIAGNRWCERIGRAHKSNNIMLIADLQKSVVYQKCHDPDCRAVNFKSEEVVIPERFLPVNTQDDPAVSDNQNTKTPELDDDSLLTAVNQIEEGLDLNEFL